MMTYAPELPRGEHAGKGLRVFLGVVRRHTLALCLSFVLPVLLGWLLADHLPRSYTANAILSVDARKVHIVENEVVSRLPQENEAIRTELDIITSRSLAERVVDRLALATDPDALHEVGEDRTLRGLLGRALGYVGRRAGARGMLSDAAPPAPGRLDVVNWLQDHLSTSNDGRSFTIFVSFTSESPVRAAQLANAFAHSYLDDQIELKAATTRKASQWLAARLAEMRQEVASADAAVADFRRSSGLVEAKGTTLVAQQLSDLNTQLAMARAELARAEGRLQMARASNGTALPDVLASVTVQQLQVQLAQAETRLAERSRLLLDVPGLQTTVTSLKAELAAETARVVAGIANEVEAARTKVASLQATIQQMQVTYDRIFGGTVRLNQLEREAEASQSVYEALLTRYKQAVEQESLAAADARIIAEAQIPDAPVFPKRLPILVISGVFGLLMGGGVVALSERLDDRVRDISSIEADTGIPILGMIPKVSFPRWGGVRGHLRLQRRPQVGVALQWLQTALECRSARGSQVVLVTSAVAAEGKTSVCVWLARELARAGIRVLVIDADPYRPRLAAIFGGSRQLNLALIASDERAVADVAQIDAASGAHYISASSLKDFRRLVRSGALARFLAAARQSYDVILLDSAPVLAGASVAAIGRLADARLCVVRCGWTKWEQLHSALAWLRKAGNVVDGLVITQSASGGSYYGRATGAVPGQSLTYDPPALPPARVG